MTKMVKYPEFPGGNTMKPHRQLRSSKTIGDPSSKFAYTQNIDEVVTSKEIMIESVESIVFEQLDSLIRSQIIYTDDTVMTQSQKMQIIIEAVKKIKVEYAI